MYCHAVSLCFLYLLTVMVGFVDSNIAETRYSEEGRVEELPKACSEYLGVYYAAHCKYEMKWVRAFGIFKYFCRSARIVGVRGMSSDSSVPTVRAKVSVFFGVYNVCRGPAWKRNRITMSSVPCEIDNERSHATRFRLCAQLSF